MDMENNRLQNTLLPIVKVGGILMLICAVIALILSFVNFITRDKILENAEADRRNAIIALFESENVEYSLVTEAENVSALYAVKEEGIPLGYCANVSSAGFGGNIDMMVAMSDDGEILGIKILSLSETPGLGNRVSGESFLSQFIGKGQSLGTGSDIDVISGATVSSKAVVSGVNTATSALAAVLSGGEVK